MYNKIIKSRSKTSYKLSSIFLVIWFWLHLWLKRKSLAFRSKWRTFNECKY